MTGGSSPSATAEMAEKQAILGAEHTFVRQFGAIVGRFKAHVAAYPHGLHHSACPEGTGSRRRCTADGLPVRGGEL